MKKVSIIYHSGTGYTAKMAEAVASGAREVEGVEVQVFRIVGEQITNGRWKDDAVIEQLTASDAIIFGSPTYMGSVSGQFKCFADATSPSWFQHKWKNKLAGGFTVSGGPSGDKVMTQHYFVTFAMQHGMLWVGQSEFPSDFTGSDEKINQWTFFTAVGARGGVGPDQPLPDEGDLKTGALYGKRVAELTLKMGA